MRRIELIILVIAALVFTAVMGFRMTGGPSVDPPLTPVALDAPVKTDAATLDEALYLYVIFFAIRHDHYLASEWTANLATVTLSGLPDGLDADGQLARFPEITANIGNDVARIVRLDKPHSDVMQTAVYCDPANRRIQLIQGLMLVQDGYGGLVRYLKGAAPCAFTIEMRFRPEEEDPGDLGEFAFALAGRITKDGMVIEESAGRLASRKQIDALLTAAKVFNHVQRTELPADRYTFESADEARAVQKLADRVHPQSVKIVQQDGKFIVTENALDAGILLAYLRHADAVFAQPSSAFAGSQYTGM